jgi:hypothetical protein
MRQTFILLTIFTTTLLVSCTSYGQEKDDYSANWQLNQDDKSKKFHGVILINWKGKTKYKIAFDIQISKRKLL